MKDEIDAKRTASRRPPVVSAIIPCLDEEAAIGQVVTAVLAQNVSEVVVVDGGSQDRTTERAEAAGGSRNRRTATRLRSRHPGGHRSRAR